MSVSRSASSPCASLLGVILGIDVPITVRAGRPRRLGKRHKGLRARVRARRPPLPPTIQHAHSHRHAEGWPVTTGARGHDSCTTETPSSAEDRRQLQLSLLAMKAG